VLEPSDLARRCDPGLYVEGGEVIRPKCLGAGGPPIPGDVELECGIFTAGLGEQGERPAARVLKHLISEAALDVDDYHRA